MQDALEQKYKIGTHRFLRLDRDKQFTLVMIIS